MTEREKMQQGLLYDANNDPDLIAERVRCKDLCHQLNGLKPSQVKEQEALLRQILGKTGEHFYITTPFWCDYGCTAGHPLDAPQRNQGLEYAYPITVGDNVWFGASVTVLPGVTIGSNTVIGAGSLVNRDIPDGVVAVGNPCRVLRKITEADKRKYWRNDHEI